MELTGDRKRPLAAGKEVQMVCQCKGSRPSPEFRWFVGKRELDVGHEKMTVEHHGSAAASDNGDEEEGFQVARTSSVIKFVPKPEDNGQYIVCKATNAYFAADAKEDGYIINVHCK